MFAVVEKKLHAETVVAVAVVEIVVAFDTAVDGNAAAAVVDVAPWWKEKPASQRKMMR